jgi:hypothetical protein
MKQTDTFHINSLDIKRCYFDGKIVVKCPECGHDISHDFRDAYLSFPKVGDDGIGFYCANCNNQWDLPIRIVDIAMQIEYDPSLLKKE